MSTRLCNQCTWAEENQSYTDQYLCSRWRCRIDFKWLV